MVMGHSGEQESLSPFERHIKQALRLYNDSERLGEESPLASSYMLGRAFRGQGRPLNAHERGKLLRHELHGAAQRLWDGPLPATSDAMLQALVHVRRNPDDPRYSYAVLELRCFNDYITPLRTSDIWEQPHLLPGSKSQHYRDFDTAVKRLAHVLLDELRPALRPEFPRPPAMLYGYENKLAQLKDRLAQQQTVLLSGPGGVGKTSLAATAVNQFNERPVFWFTLRPGFNDGSNSLLMALGAFLHEQGATQLWHYLASNNGQVGELHLAAGLLRQDLATLTARGPILCFDDLEHVSTVSLSRTVSAHSQLLDLIESMRGCATVLLISQRLLLTCDFQIELHGLAKDDVVRIWADAGFQLSASQSQQLHSYTGGNPRLLSLLLALHQNADDQLLDLDQPTATALLLPAFQRLWQRLDVQEQRTLQRLSVFQGYAPEDVFPDATLAVLEQLSLVERDRAGGVTLLRALSPAIAHDLSPDMQRQLHEWAALVRLERGEYTAAAYHLVQGGQEQQAVQLWFPQRRQALARGEADSARPIFYAISQQRLGSAERKALDLIRAELHQYAGEYEAGLTDLERTDWADVSETSARLWMVRGEFQEELGFPDRALGSYGEGTEVITRLLGQLMGFRQRRGMLYYRRRDLKQSWQAVFRAEFDLELLRGLLREEEGAYDTALTTFSHLRTLADQLEDDGLRAMAERQLARVCGRREQLDDAIFHARHALEIYERVGDRVNLEKMRSNLSSIYVQTRQFEQALAVGQQAHAFFVAAHNPHFAATTAANMAEAAYGLGDLAAAEGYANEVVRLDQPFATHYARFTLGQVALARHEPAVAMQHLNESLRLAEQNGDLYMVAYAQRALGQALAASGERASAHESISNALARFRELNIPSEIAATEQLLAEQT